MSGTEKRSDHQRVMALMKEIKSPDGYEPMPWTQIRWQTDPDQPLVNRLWGWLCSKTIKKGHWSPYAVDTGRDGKLIELHLENAAAALKVDEANMRRAWREGVESGYWRNGTKAEGLRRLYICGNVPKPTKSEENEKTEVCTDLYGELSSNLCKQIVSWPDDKKYRFFAWYKERQEVRKLVLADVMDVARGILDEEDDTGLRAWSLEPSRNKPHKNGIPAQAIEARQARIAPLLPEVQRFVQTSGKFVQTSEFSLYRAKNGSVQTSATLLSEKKIDQGRDERASADLDGPSRRRGPAGSVDEKKSKVGYPAEMPELDENEKQAVNSLFREFRKMQEAFPHTDFSAELISPTSKPDQVLVYRVLRAVGAANVDDFVSSCRRKFKGLDKNALGKLPARAPGMEHGPRSFGLILAWAVQYGEALTEAARAGRAERERVRAIEMQACRDLLGDEQLPESDKAHWREMLRGYEQVGG